MFWSLICENLSTLVLEMMRVCKYPLMKALLYDHIVENNFITFPSAFLGSKIPSKKAHSASGTFHFTVLRNNIAKMHRLLSN